MATKRYVAKIVKFMLSNPADLKRLKMLSGISFSKYVKGKLDEDLGALQEQVLRLQKENADLKGRGSCAPATIQPPKVDNRINSVNDWFED